MLRLLHSAHDASYACALVRVSVGVRVKDRDRVRVNDASYVCALGLTLTLPSA